MLLPSQIAFPPNMSPVCNNPSDLNTEERLKFTHKIFDISQVADMIEYHRKTYNYNIKLSKIGKLVLSEDSLTFILG